MCPDVKIRVHRRLLNRAAVPTVHKRAGVQAVLLASIAPLTATTTPPTILHFYLFRLTLSRTAMSLVPPSPTASVPPPYDTKDAGSAVPPSPTFTTASEEKRELAKIDADAAGELCCIDGSSSSLHRQRFSPTARRPPRCAPRSATTRASPRRA